MSITLLAVLAVSFIFTLLVVHHHDDNLVSTASGTTMNKSEMILQPNSLSDTPAHVA